MKTKSVSWLWSDVHSVGVLNVNGGRFVRYSHGPIGETCVLIGDADPVGALFNYADTEAAKARECMKRASLARCAARKLSRERQPANEVCA